MKQHIGRRKSAWMSTDACRRRSEVAAWTASRLAASSCSSAPCWVQNTTSATDSWVLLPTVWRTPYYKIIGTNGRSRKGWYGGCHTYIRPRSNSDYVSTAAESVTLIQKGFTHSYALESGIFIQNRSKTQCHANCSKAYLYILDVKLHVIRTEVKLTHHIIGRHMM